MWLTVYLPELTALSVQGVTLGELYRHGCSEIPPPTAHVAHVTTGVEVMQLTIRPETVA
jgi:hypothetical protein